MAFEMNPALNRVANPGQQYNQMPFGPTGPRMGMQPANPNQGWGSYFNDLIFGTQPQFGFSSPFSQGQSQGLDSLMNMGMYNQQNPYAGWDEFQNALNSNFSNNVIPEIANRFTGMGGGSLSSPDFSKQVGGGLQGLAQQLAQHKMQYGQNNRQFGLQQTQLGLTPQYESTYQGAQPGIAHYLANAIPKAAGAYFGGGF